MMTHELVKTEFDKNSGARWSAISEYLSLFTFH